MTRASILTAAAWVVLELLGGVSLARAEAEVEVCPGILAAEAGYLRLHPDNPRYLTDGTPDPATGRCKVVVLSGAHTWSIFQDWMADGAFAAGSYLDGLVAQGHNFTRGWFWEDDEYRPVAWARAPDGRYDLTDVTGDDEPEDPANNYLDRLVERVQLAKDRNLFISVMLFQGWSVGHEEGRGGRRHPFSTAHPFAESRNNQVGESQPEVDGDSDPTIENGMELHRSGGVGDAKKYQKSYVEAVVAALQDFDNVIWEITNESHHLSWSWQFEMIDHIRHFERDVLGVTPHLVWMSCSSHDGSISNRFMTDVANHAEIVSPCKASGYSTAADANPPEVGANSKVVIADSDHIGAFKADNSFPVKQFVWKMFTRGMHPIFMDLTTGLTWWNSPKWDTARDQWDDIRSALGTVQSVLGATGAELVAMSPQVKDSSSPAQSGFGLFTTENPRLGDPKPNGKQFLFYETARSTTLCSLVPGGHYTAAGYNEVSGVLRAQIRFTAASGCERIQIAGKVVFVKLEEGPTATKLAAVALLTLDPSQIDDFHGIQD